MVCWLWMVRQELVIQVSSLLLNHLASVAPNRLRPNRLRTFLNSNAGAFGYAALITNAPPDAELHIRCSKKS